ncbi:hypothetical protein [Flammeovirga pacifica]|nr:hypothetical protein [Flammeovirga pacifica]
MKTNFLIILILISLEVLSCDCEPYNIQVQSISAIENTELIFIGEVISQNEEDGVYKLKVLTQYKGPTKEYFSGTDIISYEGDLKGKSYCSWWPYKVGEKYLIYASFSNSQLGTIFIHQCSLTRSITNPHYHFSYDFNIDLEMYKIEMNNITEEMLDEERINIAQRELKQEIEYLEKLKNSLIE